MSAWDTLSFALTMFAFGWMACWLCTFSFHNGNVRKWLGGHVHPGNVERKR